MQQILAAHQIPCRIVDLGLMPYTGFGSPAALQVLSEDWETALALLNPVEEEASPEETQE
jgi:hypothetical protein